MAKGDEVEAVFEKLEKVFNPEINFEYDEALEELGLHTAKVRKTYPNLFKALQFPSRVTESSTSTKELLAAVKALGQNGHVLSPRIPPGELPMYQPPSGNVGEVPVPAVQVEDTEPAIRVMPYSEWAQGPAKVASMGQDYAYRWDIPNAPPFQVTETFVLKNREDGGRTRFHVQNLLDDMTYQVKVVAILPRGD